MVTSDSESALKKLMVNPVIPWAFSYIAGNLESVSLPSGLILPNAWARTYKTFDWLQLLKSSDAFRTKGKSSGTATLNTCSAHLWKSNEIICNCTAIGYLSSSVWVLNVHWDVRCQMTPGLLLIGTFIIDCVPVVGRTTTPCLSMCPSSLSKLDALLQLDYWSSSWVMS